jgi:ferric iron reductase protein FhuF
MTSTGVQLPAWCSIFEFGTVRAIRETALSNAIKRRELQILAAVILADPGSALRIANHELLRPHPFANRMLALSSLGSKWCVGAVTLPIALILALSRRWYSLITFALTVP